MEVWRPCLQRGPGASRESVLRTTPLAFPMIIPAGPAHPLAMAAIHAAAFPPSDAWGPAVIAAQLGQPGVFGLIDESGGMLLARIAADEAEILTLAVCPEARRHGIARALLAEAVSQARARGAARLLLEVSALNEAACRLYETTGFMRVGLRKRYYADGADALILALPLMPNLRPGANTES